MQHQPEALRERRVARARARRRRRRGTAGGLVLVGAAAAVAILVATSASGVAHHPRAHTHRLVASTAGPSTAKAVAHSPHAWGLLTATQARAVRHLASYGLPLLCAGSAKPMVALTFDDGPGVYTHLALRKLRQFHAVATFFLVGKELSAWPGWAQREKPYAVFGDHTMTHPLLPGLPQPAMVHEISAAQTLIAQTVGEPIVLFRPPYEARSPAIQREVTSLGMLQILWNVDSQDSLGANYAGIEQNVIGGLRPGSIILMHENRGQTIRALPTIFAALRRRHLQAVTVPQLVAEDPPSLKQLRAGGLGCGVRGGRGNGG